MAKANPSKKRDTIRNKDFNGLRDLALCPLTKETLPLFEEVLEECFKALFEGRALPGLSPARLAVVLAGAGFSAASPSAVLACFKGLLRLGPTGVIQGAALLKSGALDLDRVLELFVELPVGERLLMADQLLREPGVLDPELRVFMQERLAELSGEYAHEIKRYVLSCGEMSFAVADTLMEGVAGDYCRTVIDNPGKAAELARCLRLSRGRLDKGALGNLAEHLASGKDDVRAAILREISQSPPDGGGALVKPVLTLLVKGNARLKKLALAALTGLRPPKLPEVFSNAYARLPSLRSAIISLLPRFPRPMFMAFFKGIPPNLRRGAMFSLYKRLCEADPSGMDTVIRTGAGKTPGAKKILGIALSYVPEHEPSRSDPPSPPKTEEVVKRPKESFFGFGKKSKGIVEFGDGGGDSGQTSATCKIYEGRTFDAEGYDKSRFTGAYFQGCAFTGTVFRGCDLSGAVFRDCAFTRVSFESCDLSGSWWHDCRLSEVGFSLSFLGEAVFEGGSGCMVRLRGVDFTGASVNAFDLRCLAMENTDMTGASFTDLNLSGALYRDVLFSGARCAHCVTMSVDMEACVLDDGLMDMCEVLHPRLLDLEEQGFLRRLEEGAEAVSEPPDGLGREGFALVAAAVGDWFEKRAMRRKLYRFLRDNFRKKSWGVAKLGPERAEFYRILPYLLSSDACHKAFGLPEDTPRCRIPGYTPDHETLALTREHFPEAGPLEDDGRSMRIDALFTIGSMGSVAQSEDSDLDYWVCSRLEDATKAEAALLADKLERITRWADEALGLEAYFFLMDVEDVRANNFGFSDQESSGSAQALILKEEFYRSALLTAGLPPLWWVVPPGAGEKTYARYGEKARALLGDEAILDLGHVAQIPPEEFFGASLWQIVKGLKSPFKSVMKFALLERYTAGEGGGALLCERVKRNILSGGRGLTTNDPYVLMYREVVDHYLEVRDEDAVSLVSYSFFLKAGLAAASVMDLPPTRREEKELPEIFSQAVSHGASAPGDRPGPMDMSFEAVMELGGRVNQFLIKTYLKVREAQAEGIRALITPEDLTKLGRKIFTTFSKRRDKVDRIPFLKTMHACFTELHVRTAQRGKDERVWSLEGGRFDESIKRAKLSKLKIGPAICPIMAWVTTNGLMGESAIVKADLSTSPVTAQDFEELLQSLAVFFPADLTFDTDIGENVKPERLARAFFVLNFTVAREIGRPSEVNLIYSTNWGELFCVELPSGDETLSVDPAAYLRNHLKEVEVPDKFEMGQFVPARSQCPGLLMV